MKTLGRKNPHKERLPVEFVEGSALDKRSKLVLHSRNVVEEITTALKANKLVEYIRSETL